MSGHERASYNRYRTLKQRDLFFKISLLNLSLVYILKDRIYVLFHQKRKGSSPCRSRSNPNLEPDETNAYMNQLLHNNMQCLTRWASAMLWAQPTIYPTWTVAVVGTDERASSTPLLDYCQQILQESHASLFCIFKSSHEETYSTTRWRYGRSAYYTEHSERIPLGACW